MSHTTMMKRAWQYMRTYRVLWIFGMILALTTTSWSGVSSFDESNREEWQLNLGIEPGDRLPDIMSKTVRELDRLAAVEETNQQLDEFFLEVFAVEVDSNITPYLLSLIGFMAVTYLLAKGASYVGETAMIRMVARHEDTQQKHPLREALRLGWSRAAVRLFLIDLAMVVLMAIFIALLLTLGVAPWMLWGVGSAAAGILGMITSISIFILGAFLIIAVLMAFSLLKPIIWRACVLEELGVLASARRGLAIIRQRLQDAGLTWLITIAVRFTWPLLLAPLLLLTVAAGLISGLAALLTYGAAQLAAGTTLAVFLAVGAGISLFILAIAAPLIFLGGLREVFLSSLWTLTYRELQERSSAKSGEAQTGAAGPAGLEAMAGARS